MKNIIFDCRTEITPEEQIENFNNHKTDIAFYKNKFFNDFISALYNLMIKSLSRKTPNLENEIGRTVYISHGKVSGKLKKRSSKTKKQLFDNGFAAAQKFFKDSATQ